MVLDWDTVEEPERERVGLPDLLGVSVPEEDTLTERLAEEQLVELTEALEEVETLEEEESEVMKLGVGTPAAQKTDALRSSSSQGREGKQPLHSSLMVTSVPIRTAKVQEDFWVSRKY